MFRFHRTAHVSRGNFQEAVQFAKEVSDHINTKYAPVSVQPFLEQFGDTGAFHWFADYEDLAAIEKFNTQLLMDQEYWVIVNKAANLFIEGSVHDTLMQSL